MSIPTPKEFPSPDFKQIPTPAPTPTAKKDPDHESNWITSSTNSLIEINRVTGKMRTKDFNPHIPT